MVDRIAAAAGAVLLDVHSDPWHNRSVLTLGGADARVESAARAVAAAGVGLIDLRAHSGAHPRLGAVDVVPFVPLAGAAMAVAVAARDAFCLWAGNELGVPCFAYGPERSLPEVRRHAFVELAPDVGPSTPHPSAGAMAVGARPVLVAFNVWLAVGIDVDVARDVARALRAEWPGVVRALGLDLGGRAQVSCNLVAPAQVGPAAVFDFVEARAEVDRAELVGLVPSSVLAAVPAARWRELDLSPERTIEARLSALWRT